MQTNIEQTILRNLLTNESYMRKVIPFIKREYFEGVYQQIFSEVTRFVGKYNSIPTLESFKIEIEQSDRISDSVYTSAMDILPDIFQSKEENEQWLINTTEKWCQDRAVYRAIMESIAIIDGKNEKLSKNSLPSILQDALSVSFDTNIGHDYLENVEERYAFYHEQEDRIPFDLNYFNQITKGGLKNKTLNIALAGCVHPDTKIRVRVRMWQKNELSIGEVKALLEEGYEIEVDSPDGYVPVNFFVDKGMHQEFLLQDEYNKTVVRCNGDHLFETTLGWVSAKELCNKGFVPVLTDSGNYEKYEVVATGEEIPIVDINVDHPNHRYYTNGVSSHNTGVGKSLFMCHVAASALSQGRNVLYITMEMAEERIAERIDANLLNVPIDQLENMSKDMFSSRVRNIANSTKGKLIIKEYPTGQAHSGHFRALLTELKLKRKFVPEMIFIDYLNICASSRLKSMGGAINSYTYIKSVAEELRGLAVEFGLPIVSATQTTRAGYGNSDPGLEDTSESFGLPATADLMFALISNENLDSQSQIMVKQLKNRYQDLNIHKRFLLHVDRSKMRLSDVDEDSQDLVDDSIPVFDRSISGDKLRNLKLN